MQDMRAWLGWMRRLLLLALLAAPAGVWAQPAQALPFSDRDDGISCTYYDVQLGIPW